MCGFDWCGLVNVMVGIVVFLLVKGGLFDLLMLLLVVVICCFDLM